MIDQLEQVAAEYVNWTIESMVISGRAALLILLTLFRKTRGALASKCYVCVKNGQHFYAYEGMMRYVNYARRPQLPVYMPSFDVEKYDKLNVDEQTYEDVLNDVAGMNSETFYEKAWGTGANDVEAPALGNTGPKTHILF
ncbi:hypothetical protein LWI29_002415 [Acer saccharum]|uniref:Uncharacterized protein n=1 Tax=Acer saccharum TaxID=4024 RepID=A0AA39VAS8_ACESA|nr:hypothetical protein LWI29_002415 [Acer saccharum]